MKKYYVLVLSLLLLLALGTGALAAQVQEIEERTFALAEEGSVSVENVAGNIVIYAWDEEQVKMIATKSARAVTKKRAEELIEAIDIEISANEDQIDIDTEFPWWDSLDPTSSLRVDYELWIPLSAQARAESVSGAIEIERIKGDAEAKTTSGAIKIRQVEGEIEKRRLRGTIGEGDIGITLKTTSGDKNIAMATLFRIKRKRQTVFILKTS